LTGLMVNDYINAKKNGVEFIPAILEDDSLIEDEKVGVFGRQTLL